VRPVEATKPAADCTANGPRRDDLAGRQIGPVTTPECPGLQGQRLDAPIRIDVVPMARGKWRATFNRKTLCLAAAPMVKAARILIGQAFDPNLTLEMWHANATAWALRGRLGAVALTVLDGERAAQRRAKNRPLDRSSGKAARSFTPGGATS
jgi:hypothetical protein